MRRPGKLRDKEERIMYKNIEKQTALELREQVDYQVRSSAAPWCRMS